MLPFQFNEDKKKLNSDYAIENIMKNNEIHLPTS